MSLVTEAPGFLQVFSDGTVKRFNPKTVDPSATLSDKYKSNDVTIDPSKSITARIFSPSDPVSQPKQQQQQQQKLPVIVYFHGGGFCIGSTTWLGYHVFLGNLSAVAQAYIVSIDYRLAPEHRLPIAYNDCIAALEWLGSASGPWLDRADRSRVFLCGDSAGGNIAHRVAALSVKGNIPGIGIRGLLPIHPFFGSDERTELEAAGGGGSADEVAMNDMFWRLSLPEGSGRGFYGCDYTKEDAEWARFPAVLVFVAGMDFLRERGVMYAEFLKGNGVERVNLIEADEEGHVFHVWNPESEATFVLQKQIAIYLHFLRFSSMFSPSETLLVS
ncbi:alpha/beta-Hydrolases superfamily protein [Striga asiatica]|uniref:Alpha/beta-Hydrolases superfamily protein n=1 Tax=Striga asiatica TaxID=4170 RepID=A0A5A7R1V4_STRAF|nr:alpha/beta-Hydrolases superfamily protein [Striga asiatica]